MIAGVRGANALSAYTRGVRAVCASAIVVCFALLVLPHGALAQRAPRLPMLEGRALWDEPVERAPQAVRDAIDRTRRALEDRLPPPRGRTSGAEAWSRDAVAPWLRRRIEAISETERTLGPLAAGSDDLRAAALGAVLVARLSDDLVTQLEGAPLPRELAGDPELAAAYRETMRGATGPIVTRAQAAYRACAELAPRAPEPLRAWASHCAARIAALEPRIAEDRRAAEERARVQEARRTLSGAARVPPGCEPAASPSPSRAAPQELAVVYEGTRLRGALRARVLRAIEQRLRRDAPDLTVIPAAEIARTGALVRARRTTARGPVCAVAPSLTHLLRESHPDVVVATAREDCTRLGEDPCRLELRIDPPDAIEGLTWRQEVAVTGDPPAAGAWLAAVDALGSSERGTVGVLGVLRDGAVRDGALLDGASLGALRGEASLGATAPVSAPYFAVAPSAAADPRLDAARSLRRARDALRRCWSGRGIARFDVALTVAPDGATRDAAVTVVPDTLAGDPAAVDAVRACVQRVVAATEWTCPTSGADTRIEASLCLGSR